MKKLMVVLMLVVLAVTAFAGTITPNSNDARDQYQILKELVYAVNNKALSSAVIAINAGAKAKFDTTGNYTVVNNGVLNAVASNTAHTFTAPVSAIPAGYRGVFIIGAKADDSIVTKQSRSVLYDHQLVTPMLADGVAPIGLIKVAVDSDGIFTPNTTLLDDASCTVTITNLHSLPLSLDVKTR